MAVLSPYAFDYFSYSSCSMVLGKYITRFFENVYGQIFYPLTKYKSWLSKAPKWKNNWTQNFINTQIKQEIKLHKFVLINSKCILFEMIRRRICTWALQQKFTAYNFYLYLHNQQIHHSNIFLSGVFRPLIFLSYFSL